MDAVIFDLDDTLFDHLHCARTGLVKLSERHAQMQQIEFGELEDRYSVALESIHLRLLRGEVTQAEARTHRMQQLFGSFGIKLNDRQAMAEYRQFRRDYDAASQVVPGSRELLSRLAKNRVRLAIITNNLVSEQTAKLKELEIDHYFEVVSISEAVGVAKPDPRIFEVTLEELALSASDVVMLGDSLTSDIAGAVGVGIPCVWLNRRPDSIPSVRPPDGVPIIERDFTDIESVVQVLASSSISSE